MFQHTIVQYNNGTIIIHSIIVIIVATKKQHFRGGRPVWMRAHKAAALATKENREGKLSPLATDEGSWVYK